MIGPAVADLATSHHWVEEYLANEVSEQIPNNDWPLKDVANPIRASPDLISEPKWAEEYLEESERAQQQK